MRMCAVPPRRRAARPMMPLFVLMLPSAGSLAGAISPGALTGHYTASAEQISLVVSGTDPEPGSLRTVTATMLNAGHRCGSCWHRATGTITETDLSISLNATGAACVPTGSRLATGTVDAEGTRISWQCFKPPTNGSCKWPAEVPVAGPPRLPRRRRPGRHRQVLGRPRARGTARASSRAGPRAKCVAQPPPRAVTFPTQPTRRASVAATIPQTQTASPAARPGRPSPSRPTDRTWWSSGTQSAWDTRRGWRSTWVSRRRWCSTRRGAMALRWARKARSIGRAATR
jgi:hypothetical protein